VNRELEGPAGGASAAYVRFGAASRAPRPRRFLDSYGSASRQRHHPAYNTAPFIAETLASVFAQTVHDDEVIVVNDGSPDTLEFERAIQPFKNRIRYTVQTNRALSAARNTGIAASRAELVALLDSDDVWEHDYLAWQVDVLRRGRFDIVYPNARPFGDPTRSGRLSWISIRRAAK
jgi:glycosyltransferase involved in cell wall biosynthesis